MSDMSAIMCTKETTVADVKDDEIPVIPLDRGSDECHSPVCIYPVVEVKPEDLQDMKQEPTDEYDIDDLQCGVSVPVDRESDHYCIERAPFNRNSDNYHMPEFMHHFEVMPEDQQDVKQEPADEYDIEGLQCGVNVPVDRESNDYCIERAPFNRNSDNHHMQEFKHHFEVMPEELQVVKQEHADEDNEGLHYSQEV